MFSKKGKKSDRCALTVQTVRWLVTLTDQWGRLADPRLCSSKQHQSTLTCQPLVPAPPAPCVCAQGPDFCSNERCTNPITSAADWSSFPPPRSAFITPDMWRRKPSNRVKVRQICSDIHPSPPCSLRPRSHSAEKCRRAPPLGGGRGARRGTAGSSLCVLLFFGL